jgi:nucleotide-binding universal stress UspA family protein
VRPRHVVRGDTGNALGRILVASDLSARARRALARARQLATQHGAALTALTVVAGVGAAASLRESARLSPGLRATILKGATAALRRQLGGRAAERAPHIATLATIGTPFVEIIRQARKRDAGLIVLGAHGGGFLRELLFGTTAERVIRKGDRPVLVVKRASVRPYRHVLVAVDFSETSRRALVAAAQLAPHARFQLLHAYEVSYEARLRAAGAREAEIRRLHDHYRDKARAQLEELIEASGLDRARVSASLRRGHPAAVIRRALAVDRVDLVAIGTHGLAGLRYILLGSVAEHVLREAPSDVLVVRPTRLDFALP